jgi:hypothetical protein
MFIYLVIYHFSRYVPQKTKTKNDIKDLILDFYFIFKRRKIKKEIERYDCSDSLYIFEQIKLELEQCNLKK